MQPVRQRHYLPEFLGAMGAVCVLFFVPSVHAQSISAEPTVNRLPSEFNAYLAEGYRQMALVAARAALGDRIVYYFRQRDALAAEGETVVPQLLDPRKLDSWTLREATFARRELLATLDGGARQRQALLAAIAQVNFDCWIVALPHRLGVPNSDECRRRFYFAFAGLNDAASLAAPREGSVLVAELPTAAATNKPASATTSAWDPLVPVVLLRPATSNAPLTAPSIAALPDPAVCETNCAPLAFTGPEADTLIHVLARTGEANDTHGGSSGGQIAGSGGSSGNGNGYSGENGNGNGSGNGNGYSGGNGSVNGNGNGNGGGNGNGSGNGGGNGHGAGNGKGNGGGKGKGGV
jgi:hypothetical protein